jgi:hypothetical protein
VCNIEVDDATYPLQDKAIAYYCVPIIEDRQWEDLNSRMGLIENLTNQESPLEADLCKEVHAMSNDKKSDDSCLNDLLELQEKVNKHNTQINELVTNHVEDQQRAVPAEAPKESM